MLSNIPFLYITFRFVYIPANAGDAGSIPEWGRSPGEGNVDPLEYSCLGNYMDRRSWWATVHTVAKSQSWPSDWTTTFHFVYICHILFIHSSTDGNLGYSTFCLLWITLLWTQLCKYLSRPWFQFFWKCTRRSINLKFLVFFYICAFHHSCPFHIDQTVSPSNIDHCVVSLLVSVLLG